MAEFFVCLAHFRESIFLAPDFLEDGFFLTGCLFFLNGDLNAFFVAIFLTSFFCWTGFFSSLKVALFCFVFRGFLRKFERARSPFTFGLYENICTRHSFDCCFDMVFCVITNVVVCRNVLDNSLTGRSTAIL